ncbi:MAG TPA: hypothetical protein VGM25_15530 [Caulobacteraceae bacterium]|jgi:hypothetical protein
MKTIILGLAAAGILAAAPAAFAQDTTVIHKDDGGDRSKTVVKRDNGSKTVIERKGDREKKVHVGPAGEKTVIKKKGDIDHDHDHDHDGDR